MIKTKVFIFNPFLVNTIVLSDESGEGIIIDASCYTQKERDELDQYITENYIKPVRLINTHCHVDHLLGCAYVANKYNIGVELHEGDLPVFKDAKQHGMVFGFDVDELPPVKGFLLEGHDVTFGNSSLQVLYVPGHSPGSVAFFNAAQKLAIVGDVLFKGTIGRTDLPGGNYDQLIKSITSKLMTMPPDTEVIPGHGPSTTIKEESLSNPFLT
jgi:hydroxyacylglutathione hydrolase